MNCLNNHNLVTKILKIITTVIIPSISASITGSSPNLIDLLKQKFKQISNLDIKIQITQIKFRDSQISE